MKVLTLSSLIPLSAGTTLESGESQPPERVFSEWTVRRAAPKKTWTGARHKVEKKVQDNDKASCCQISRPNYAFVLT